MERKLASIQLINDIQPIPGADAIVVAGILGWKVVVKKNEFQVGDKCVYCEVDSILPEKPEYEFLRPRNFRIKTVRLRKQLSQGIAFPMSVLPAGNYEDGQDVTELMGVRKFEPAIPAQLSGIVKRPFPGYLPKTDETRLQSVPEVIAEIMGREVYITTKMDGTSATFSYYDGEIDVCSRNLSLKETEGNTFWKVFRKYDIEGALKKVGNFAIQGELCGPSIQKNRIGLSDHEVYIFNVYDIQKGRFLDYKDFIAFCADYRLQTVPVEEVTIFNFTLEQLLERAKGAYKSGKLKEGIVIRPTTEMLSNALGGRMSFKVLNNDFLEKEEE